MKHRRDSNDPDATEKDLDRVLFQIRSQQNLLRTLPLSRAPPIPSNVSTLPPLSGSGGKLNKALAVPSTILESEHHDHTASSSTSAHISRGMYLSLLILIFVFIYLLFIIMTVKKVF